MKARALTGRIAVLIMALSLALGNIAVIPRAFAASQPITDIPQWTASYNNNGADGEAYIDHEQTYAGSAGSLKLVNRTPKTNNVFLAIRQHVTVKPNTVYQVSLQVKAVEANRVNVMLNPEWTVRKLLPEGTYDWQPVSFTITTNASTTSFPFVILSDGLAEAVWIDDIVMAEKGTTQNLLKNGDFETLAPVAGVTADVPPGAVEPGTLVSLSTATVSASVYYTLDLTDPTTSPTRQWYTGPIAIDRPLAIKAYAEKRGLASSPVSTFQYTLALAAGVTHTDAELFLANLAYGKAVPVYYKDGFTIDGSLEEWSGESYITLPLASGSLPANLASWEGPQDLSAKVRFAYDEDNLYLGVQVTDNVHYALSGASMWSGDSIQLAAGTDAMFGPEYGFAHVNGQAQVWSWSAGTAVLGKDAIQLQTSRTGETTTYEAAIPWKALRQEKPEQALPFNILFNDNDGTGRKNWVEWTPGIGKYKDQNIFGNLFLIPQNAGWGAWLDRDYATAEENRITAEKGQLVDYSLYVLNPSSEEKEYQITVPAINQTWDSAKVPAHTVWRKQFQASFSQVGPQKLIAEVRDASSEGAGRSLEWNVLVLANGNEIAEELDRLAAALPELKALRDAASAQGLPMDYDDVDIAVIERFIPYGKEDVQKGRLDQAQYVAEQLDRLYRETKSRLESYLSGAATPLTAPRYVTGQVLLDGYSFIGQTVDAQGNQQTGPVFFTGYGHFAQVRKDVPQMSSFGANMIQIETGPNKVLLAADSLIGWSKGVWGGAEATFRYDGDIFQEGNRSLKITNHSPKSPNVYGTVWQRIVLKPNTEYTIRLWAKGENVNNAWFGTFDKRQPIPNGTYDWQQLTLAYKSGSAETGMDLRILSENVTDALYIDNISVEESGTSVNLAAYPGFETEGITVKEDYLISTASIRNDIQKVLQDAADHNQAVSLLLSPHYFPAFLLEKYPELKSNNTGFVKYHFDHPKAREVVEDFLRTIIPMVKDYPSLHNLVLSNEPVFMSYKDPVYLADWQQYLTGLYGSIGQLNEVYGTAFTDFTQVMLPTAVERTPLYYDWVNFNDQLFGGWHQWMADLVHEMAPDIPLNVKIMAGALSKEQLAKSPLSWGVDPEQISGLSQLNGLDAWNFLYSEGATITEKLKFYDLLASFKEAPVINTEDHIIPDKDTRLVPEQVPHVRNDLWQGAIHGRSGSIIWVWERTDDAASDLAGSVLIRPDVVSAIGRTALDLNRLAAQVTAFQKAPYETAILYSKASNLYRPAYLDAVDRAYTALSHSGQKIGFISEKQILEGKLTGLKLLVVPDSRYVDAETLSAIQSYLDHGGTVVVMGEQALQYNAHQQALDVQVRNDVMSRSTVIPVTGTADTMSSPSAASLKQELLPILSGLNLLQAEIVDAATKQPVMNVEWRLAEHDGRVLLNAANYSWTPKTVEVRLKGQPVAAAEDLIGMKPMQIAQLELAPFTPMLLDLGAAEAEPGPGGNDPGEIDDGEDNGGSTESPEGNQDPVNNPNNGTVPPPAGQPGVGAGTGSGNNGQQPEPGQGQGSTPEQPTQPEAPRDIAGHWAEAIILKAIRLGLAEGYEDGTFRAERPVTREELAVLAARWLKSQGQWPTLPGSGQGLPFRDGEDISSWAEEAIAAAVKAGWLEGYEDGSFRPQQEVTRAELAVFMQRVLALKADDSEAALPFADAAEIPSWAAQGIAAAAAAGLFQGNEQGRFLPAASATRAETVSIFLRAIK
ncbi:S-layer homology domain-containing protein [Paenibacillus sp. YN15]|uniref:S-layer homology domain-containing protein n=1 Tax=Paenibacillus sp. YN15 TaxID=1742774 RepID=UPI000DCB3395|nr:S-layer homology domain-containing protein [Paenibacillus sp. YN15]RAU98157.1 hypothetical protein DQG13_17875 [Paenibacillus sp. YN15]